MTEEHNEEYEDVFPLLGAIGPYLNFTTGHMNPVEDEEDEEPIIPIDSLDISSDPAYPEVEEQETDYWEDEEE